MTFRRVYILLFVILLGLLVSCSKKGRDGGFGDGFGESDGGFDAPPGSEGFNSPGDDGFGETKKSGGFFSFLKFWKSDDDKEIGEDKKILRWAKKLPFDSTERRIKNDYDMNPKLIDSRKLRKLNKAKYRRYKYYHKIQERRRKLYVESLDPQTRKRMKSIEKKRKKRHGEMWYQKWVPFRWFFGKKKK